MTFRQVGARVAAWLAVAASAALGLAAVGSAAARPHRRPLYSSLSSFGISAHGAVVSGRTLTLHISNRKPVEVRLALTINGDTRPYAIVRTLRKGSRTLSVTLNRTPRVLSYQLRITARSGRHKARGWIPLTLRTPPAAVRPTPTPTPTPTPAADHPPVAVGDGKTPCRPVTASFPSYSVVVTAADGRQCTTIVTPGTATAVDGDDDGVPDLRATLAVDAGRLRLEVDRINAGAALPVAVDGVLDDPGHTILGRDRLTVGYDAQDATPDQAVVSTPAAAATSATPTIAVDADLPGVTGAVTVLAKAQDSSSVSAHFADAPEHPSLSASFGSSAARSVSADVSAGGTTQLHALDSAGTPTPLDALDLTARSSVPFAGGARALVAHIDGLPGTATVAFGGTAGGATVSVPGGSLDALEFVASSQMTAAPPATGQGVVDDVAAGDFTQSVRALGARAVSAAAGGVPDVTVDRTAAASWRSETSVTGHAAVVLDSDSVPAHTELQFDGDGDGDATAHQLVVSGRDDHGAPAALAALELTASSSAKLFGDATALRANLTDVPASTALDLRQRAGRTTLDVTSAEAIGGLELRAGAPDDLDNVPLPAAGHQGVTRDVRSGHPFRLGARTTNLEDLDVTLGTATSVAATSAAGPLTLDSLTDTGDATLALNDAPAGKRVDADLVAGTVMFDDSAPIDAVTATLSTTAANALVAGGTSGEIDLDSVPAQASLALTSSSSAGVRTGVHLATTGSAIGRVDLRAHSDGRALPSFPDASGRIVLDDTTPTQVSFALRAAAPGAIDFAATDDGTSLSVDGGSTGGFVVDADLARPTTPRTVDISIPALAGSIALHLDRGADADGGGARLAWSSSTPVSGFTAALDGATLVPGSDETSAAVTGAPSGFTVRLPDQSQTPSPALLTATVAGSTTGSGGPRIDELRLAAGAALPASGGDDTLTIGANAGASVKLTNLKSASVAFTGATTAAHQLDLALDQDDTLNGGTKPIVLGLTGAGASPAPTLSGMLNKPSWHTELRLDLGAGLATAPLRLVAVNGSTTQPRTMSALSLSLAHLGNAGGSLTVANVPESLSGCVARSGACRRADRPPPALSDYAASDSGSPAQSATAGGINRPYAAGASMDFNDAGTSGTSSNISTMVTLNASLSFSDEDPVTFTNLRFHRFSLDMGDNGSFTYFGMSVPRLYLFADGGNLPFVVNGLSVAPIMSAKFGSDSSPAIADRRLAWLPGAKCMAVLGQPCGSTSLDRRASGAFDCGGAHGLSWRQNPGVGTVDVFNDGLGGNILNPCSAN